MEVKFDLLKLTEAWNKKEEGNMCAYPVSITEMSEMIQKRAFELGHTWTCPTNTDIKFVDEDNFERYLGLDTSNCITYLVRFADNDPELYEKCDAPEATLEFLNFTKKQKVQSRQDLRVDVEEMTEIWNMQQQNNILPKTLTKKQMSVKIQKHAFYLGYRWTFSPNGMNPLYVSRFNFENYFALSRFGSISRYSDTNRQQAYEHDIAPTMILDFFDITRESLITETLGEKLVKKTIEPKLPIGIMPRKMWNEQRVTDLSYAINRYAKDNIKIPKEWLEEILELQSELD